VFEVDGDKIVAWRDYFDMSSANALLPHWRCRSGTMCANGNVEDDSAGSAGCDGNRV